MTPILSFAAISIFVAAAFTDLRSRTIPNGLVLALAALGLARIALSVAETGAVPSGDLLVAVAVFAAGALAFHLGALGGGDVKLMAAGALWTGAALADEFLMITLLAGGVLALVYLALGGLARFRTGEQSPLRCLTASRSRRAAFWRHARCCRLRTARLWLRRRCPR